MKIRGIIAGQFSGSVAGVTAGHNRGGYYLRNRSGPVNPNTASQLRARENFALSIESYGVLDAEARQAWRDAAANQPWTDSFGDAIVLTGQNWYVGCNSALLTAGLAMVDVPPTPGERPALANPSTVVIETALTDADVTVTYPAAPAGAGDRVLLYFAGPLGPGRDTPPNRWRLLGSAAANTAAIALAALEVEWAVGTRIALADQLVMASGQYSSRRPIGIFEAEAAP